MVMSLRVSELQVLLGYAGRNKHGRKHELLTKALHLLKAGCSPAVHMKIKELYRRRFPAKMVSHSELAMPGPHHPATAGVVGGGGAALPAGLTQLAYEGHAGHGGAPSPAALLPLSLLGPGKHELTGLTHHLSSSTTLHPVHPDVKLQRLPFYDMLDELIKPTSLGEGMGECVLRERILCVGFKRNYGKWVHLNIMYAKYFHNEVCVRFDDSKNFLLSNYSLSQTWFQFSTK